MAQKEFLEGEITDRFLAESEEASLQGEGGQVAFITPATPFIVTMYTPLLTLTLL